MITHPSSSYFEDNFGDIQFYLRSCLSNVQNANFLSRRDDFGPKKMNWKPISRVSVSEI